MPTSWADRVAGGLQRKVANTVRRVDSNNQLERPIITTLFEVEDLQQQLIVQRGAAAIAQDILYQGSVLFTFPAADFPNRTTVYSLIQEQIGRINNVRPISKMGTQQRQDLIVEVQFD
ncbi:hypothetical protein BD408DRAFT_399758 [Parasitella parasitica]|nr:hypothetical protein BD408DRAFT_399758 [Parasitella parasitica]